MPAAYYWNPLSGSDLLASTANNWVDAGGVRMIEQPDGDDDLYFTGIEIVSTPTESFSFGEESLAFSEASAAPPGPPPPPTVNAQADCLITSSSPSAPVERHYNGVHLMAGYTGTVDFQVSSFVGTLELRAGNIAQNDAFYATAGGGHLAVTVNLDWTGGGLNSSLTSPLGWVHLVGATGTINAGADGELETGSTITLDDSELDFLEGTLVNVGIDVNDGGVFNIGSDGEDGPGQPQPEVPPLVLPQPPKVVKADLVVSVKNVDQLVRVNGIRINEGGEAEIGTNAVNEVVIGTSAQWLQNAGGKFVVGNSAEYEITGSKEFAVTQDIEKDLSYFQSSGTFSVSHGSQIKFRFGAALRGGSLTTTTATVPANDGTTKNVDAAKIVGDVLSWAKIDILKDKAGIFGNLSINGKFDWRDGELTVKVDARRPNQQDSKTATHLTVTGQIDVDTGAAGAPKAKMATTVDGLAPGATVAGGRSWGGVVQSEVNILKQSGGVIAPVAQGTGYKINEIVTTVSQTNYVREWEVEKLN